jgi:mRNA-degrading endonuclease toxin of MazEF toxin-antitoxin module
MPSLNWVGREAVERHHTTVPFHMLREDPARSYGDADSGNLLVEGDNLLALKALLPYYAGQVKCIYIDPPYNTGKQTWAYNDNVDSPIRQEWLRETLADPQIDGNDLSRHDKPCLVISPDEMNHPISTVIVAPMTMKGRPYPTRVPCRLEGMEGHVVLDRLRTVDKTRLVRRLGRLTDDVQEAVLTTLAEMFAA